VAVAISQERYGGGGGGEHLLDRARVGMGGRNRRKWAKVSLAFEIQ
jgi:hypothetical protein